MNILLRLLLFVADFYFEICCVCQSICFQMTQDYHPESEQFSYCHATRIILRNWCSQICGGLSNLANYPKYYVCSNVVHMN